MNAHRNLCAVVFALVSLFVTPALAVDYTKDIVADYGAVCSKRTVTIDIPTSTFTVPSHGMANGHAIHFFTDGAVPTGMTATSPIDPPGAPVYYTHNVTANTFQIKTTSNGATPLTLSGTQSGTHTFDTDSRPAFESFNTWARTVTTDTNTITLNVPALSDCVLMTGSTTMTANRIGFGIKKLILNGNGSILESYNDINFGAQFQPGGGSIYQEGIHAARLNNVNKNSTLLSVMTPSKITTAEIQPGRWVLIHGIDMQGGGYPPNPYHFEYVKVVSSNATTGEFIIDRPTRHYYKTTWPHYAGSDTDTANMNQGGYATVYVMQPEWDTDITYNDFQFRQYFPVTNNAAGTGASGRKLTYNNVTMLDGGTVNSGGASKRSTDSCLYVTITYDALFNNVNAAQCTGSEADKMSEIWTIKDSTIGGIGFQSASFEIVEIDHSNIGTIGGTPQVIEIKNGSVIGGRVSPYVDGAGLIPGATQYGRTERVNCSDSTIYTMNTAGGLGEAMLPEATRQWTLTNGVFRYQKYNLMAGVTIDIPTSTFTVPGHGMLSDTPLKFTAGSTLPTGITAETTYFVNTATTDTFTLKLNGSPNPVVPVVLSGTQSGSHQMRKLPIRSVKWAVPDTNLYWSGVASNQPESALQAFHITDVYDDYDYVYVQTDLTRTGFPTPANANLLNVRIHPAPSMTFRNCTGTDNVVELSKAQPKTPMGSYVNRTFTADRMKQAAEFTSGGSGGNGLFWGKVTSIKTNVTKAYAGPNLDPNSPFIVRPLSVAGMNVYDTAGAVRGFNPTIDGNVEGLRVLLPLPGTTQSAKDIIPSVNISPPFYTQGMSNIGSPVASTTMLPIVNLEVIADQNIIAPTNSRHPP